MLVTFVAHDKLLIMSVLSEKAQGGINEIEIIKLMHPTISILKASVSTFTVIYIGRVVSTKYIDVYKYCGSPNWQCHLDYVDSHS